VVERQEHRTKTPYSLDINLITTRLNIAANRYVVNRFPKSMSKCTLNTSWCAAPRRAQVHVLTYQLESLALLVIWSTLSIQKEWIWRNMQRLADPLADLNQHFQSGPSRLALNSCYQKLVPPNYFRRARLEKKFKVPCRGTLDPLRYLSKVP